MRLSRHKKIRLITYLLSLLVIDYDFLFRSQSDMLTAVGKKACYVIAKKNPSEFGGLRAYIRSFVSNPIESDCSNILCRTSIAA